MAEASDQSLAKALRDCARGERAGLRVIFNEEGGRLVAVCQRILRRRDLAEEAVQDGMIRIWSRAHQWSPERGSARGWIFAVVRSRALNMLRDASRELLPGDDEIDAMRGHEEAIASAAWDGLDQASRLRRCLSALDPQKRHSLVLAYVLGHTHGEIAGRMCVPLGTAKAWVRRGLQALRECMA